MKAQYLNHYLTDSDIANIARQSFANSEKIYSEQDNAKLIQYLARGIPSSDWSQFISDVVNNDIQTEQDAHNMLNHVRSIPTHWVPFGHPQITLRMQAPIPIRVQCFKHKVGLVESEESRRYISSTPEFFVPNFFRAKAANVKQGSQEVPMQPFNALRYVPVFEDNAWQQPSSPENRTGFKRTADPVEIYKAHCETSIQLYLDFIAAGACPEQARFILPQGCEVNWVWTGSLFAFANVFNQRSDSHAQKEIQDLAFQIDKIISPLFPIAWSALTQGIY